MVREESISEIRTLLVRRFGLALLFRPAFLHPLVPR
jgi:hypothetical protein